MLRDKIFDEVRAAMKARETQKLEALRYLWSEIKNKEIDEKADLDDSQVEAVVKSEVKKRREAIKLIRDGGREDEAKEEEGKLKYIEEFMPEQMGEEEVGKIVDSYFAEASKDREFGEAMKEIMGRTKGKADGKLVAEIVKKKLG